MIKPTLLIIDDDDQLRSMLRQTLELMGYTVAEARDGNEGLAEHLRRPADLVLTDLIMPDKEGIETIIKLRKHSPGLKIIAMSGGGRNSATGYLQTARLVGARQVLAKPFTHEELEVVVASVLAGA